MFHAIPNDDQKMPLPVVRCRAGANLRTVIACTVLRGVLTHYMNDQTMVCQNGPKCPGCERNMVPRWQGFTIVCSPETNNFALLQFTPPVAKVLQRNTNLATGILGFDITLSRLGSRINSPLLVKLHGIRQGVEGWSPKQLETVVRRLFPGGKNIEARSVVEFAG